MKPSSNIVYLFLISVLFIAGCNDDSNQVTKSHLDLKGFQIFRLDESGANQQLRFDKIRQEKSLHLTDQLGAGAYPENVTLFYTTLCRENVGNESYSEVGKIKQDSLPFTEPIHIFSFIPEDLLFNTTSSETNLANCTLNLYAKDKSDNTYKLSDPLEFVVSDEVGHGYLHINEKGKDLTTTDSTLPKVQKGQLDNYRLETQLGGVFSKVRIECETFQLRHNLSTPMRYIALNEFDWSKVQYKSPNNHDQLVAQSLYEQPCRSFAYDANETLVGFSKYYNLYQNNNIYQDFHIERKDVNNSLTTLNPNEISSTNQFHLTDTITAKNFPKGISLVVETRCKKQIDDSTFQKFSNRKKINTPQSLTIASLLPADIFFNTDANLKISCTINFSGIDSSNFEIDFPQVISGEFVDVTRMHNVEIRSNGIPLANNGLQNLESVDRTNLGAYVLQSIDSSGFDAYKLHCESFYLKESLRESDYMDFKRMDFSKAKYQDGLSASDLALLKSRPKQICRIIIFHQDQVTGFSPYFSLKRPTSIPTVSLNMTQRNTYMGSDLDLYNTNFHTTLNLGELIVSNPHDLPIYVAIQSINQVTAQLQWIGVEPALAVGPITTGWVYDSYIHYLLTSNTEVVASISNGRVVYKINGKSDLRLQYMIYPAKKCQIRTQVQNVASPGSINATGGGTLGLYYQIINPEVSLLTDPRFRKPENPSHENNITWTLSRGNILNKAFLPASPLVEKSYISRPGEFKYPETADNCGAGRKLLDFRK